MYVAHLSDEVILDVDALLTVNNVTVEVIYGLHLCDYWLIAFTG